MKRQLLPIVFVFLAFTIFAQAPQSVCYQAVATDAEGRELQAANIGVRATVLQSALNGNVVWQETHSITTDEFGLFTMEVGQGFQVDGLANFADILWGEGPYFLRIEMDATGGNNYQLMGANQILSVPYALYSERSGLATFATEAGNAMTADLATMALNADTANVAMMSLSSANDNDTSAVNELQSLIFDEATGELGITGAGATGVIIDVNDADSDPINEMQQLVFENNILTISGSNGNSVDFSGSAFGAPGASSDFPQGIVGVPVVEKMGTFTVPPGKTFYLNASGNFVKIQVPGVGIVTHPTTPNMPVFPENTNVIDCMCTGLLVDFEDQVAPTIVNLTEFSDEFIVPTDKIFYVKSGLSNDLPGSIEVDGDDMEFFRPNFTRGSRIISFPMGTVLKRPTNASPGPFVLTGFLIDANL